MRTRVWPERVLSWLWHRTAHGRAALRHRHVPCHAAWTCLSITRDPSDWRVPHCSVSGLECRRVQDPRTMTQATDQGLTILRKHIASVAASGRHYTHIICGDPPCEATGIKFCPASVATGARSRGGRPVPKRGMVMPHDPDSEPRRVRVRVARCICMPAHATHAKNNACPHACRAHAQLCPCSTALVNRVWMPRAEHLSKMGERACHGAG